MADPLSLLFLIKSDSSQARGDITSLRETVAKETTTIKSQATTSLGALSSASGNVREELNKTSLSFASTARSASSLARGVENLVAGNVLGALRNFGAFSRAAFNPTGPVTYAQSLATVATAQGSATAATTAASAASKTSLGLYGLAAFAVGALAIGIYELVNAHRQVIIVSKDEINTTQQRVALAQQELALAQQMSAATDGERQKREALVAIKKQELQAALELQKAQELAVITALTNALINQEAATKKLRDAYAGNYGLFTTVGDTVINIQNLNQNLGKSQEETKKAAEAADILSTATGKSKQELFASALAHAKLTDMLGQTQHAHTDLVHALGLVIDAQGRVVPATDAATIAFRSQIGVLADLSAQAKKTKDDIDKISAARNTYIEGEVARIVQLANGDIERAKRLLADKLKSDPNFAYQVGQKRGDTAVESVVNKQLFPSEKEQASAAEKVRKDQEGVLSEQLRKIENAYKSNTSNLQREYKLQLVNLDDFVQKSIDAENERYEKTKAALEKQQALAKPGTSEYAKYSRQLEDAEQKRADNIQKINDEADQKRIDSLTAHQDALLKLQDDYLSRSAASLRAAADARGITYEEAEQRILEIENNAFDRRLEIVTREEQRYAQNTEAFRKWNDEHKKIIEEQVAFQEEAERKIEEARQKDIDNLLKVVDTLYNTELEYEQNLRESYRQRLDDYSKWAARHIVLTRQHRAQLIYEQSALDQEEETARHAKELARLNADEFDLKRTATTEKEKLEIEKVYNGLREQEEQRHVDEQNRIARQADEATKKANGDSKGGLFGGIKEDLNNIPDLSPAAAAANAVTDAYVNMKQAVLDSVDAFIFSTATIGQVMRRATAETLAEIGKEAAIQAIKQGALAIGALAAWDLRGFALHSAAAAAWLSITGGSMLLGRAIMGSQATAGGALQQSTQGTSRTTSTTSQPQGIDVGRTTANPITVNRPTTAHESRVESLLMQVVNKLDPNKVVTHEIKPPDGWVVKEIVQNFRRNGEVRSLIVDPYNAH